MLIASVDTTTIQTLWALLNIGRFPHVQEKLYKEIVSVVPADGQVTSKHIEQLEYMRQFLRESHRFTPSTPLMTYRTLDHPIVLSGYEVPAGVRIHFGTSAVQRDPQFVDKCDEFIPERWSKEEVAKRKGTPQEVIDSLPMSKPFGLGPRMCLGARLAENEMKVFLCHLLRNWKYSFDPNVQKWKLAIRAGMVASPYPEMTMIPRENTL